MDTRHNFEFDVDLYSRTQGLFAAKRESFCPDAVESLARDVIKRLSTERVTAHDNVRAIAPSTVLPDMVESFCDALLADDSGAPLRFLENELAPIVAHRDDLYDYIAAASRRFGEKWDEDELSFLQVTIAVGKLYALVRSVGSREARSPLGVTTRKSAFFASVPGEQHTLGVTIAAEVFRDAGWDIDLVISRSHDELLDRAALTLPPVVGFSVSNSAGLVTLARLIVALRLILPDSIFAVATGPDINQDILHSLVDLDLVITDAKTAQVDLSRLLFERGEAA